MPQVLVYLCQSLSIIYQLSQSKKNFELELHFYIEDYTKNISISTWSGDGDFYIYFVVYLLRIETEGDLGRLMHVGE